MTDELQGDWLKAESQISQGRDWRGTVNVPIGNNSYTFGLRLLNENELVEVRDKLPLDEQQQFEDDQSDLHERLMELQQKDELTDEEEEEFKDVYREFSKHNDVGDKMGVDAKKKLMWAGKQAVKPTQDDVEDVLHRCDLDEQREILGSIPDHLNEQTVEDRLKGDMVETIDDQPFLIKLNLGMEALKQTHEVLGNGLPDR